MGLVLSGGMNGVQKPRMGDGWGMELPEKTDGRLFVVGTVGRTD